MNEDLRIPRATYRLQLHAGFTFRDATELVPYLHDLGISHLYCSPYLKARSGSTHGYDIVDHRALNPEIGSREDFDRLVATLAQHDMGQILDIVPNHMGVMGEDNAWWLDVLENGQASEYADYFDIDWDPPNVHLKGKLLVPVLGDHYDACLSRGELVLHFEPATGSFHVQYFGHRFPVAPSSYGVLLQAAASLLASGGDEEAARLEALASALGSLPDRDDASAQARALRQSGQQLCKRQLAELMRDRPEVARAIETCIGRLNAGKDGFEALHGLLEQQAYRLAFWRVASDEINYRRFFDINELAALRMENQAVFEATHALVLELVREGAIHGLRIDHPDGLFDPVSYFRRLQDRCAEAAGTEDFYVVCEKIIAPYEDLPGDWAVAGTTGYRFANVLNGLLVDKAAQRRFTRVHAAFTGQSEPFAEVARRSRHLVLRHALAGELTVLAGRLHAIAQADRATRDFTLNALRQALADVIAAFPVYRTYVAQGVSAEDRRYVQWAVASAKRHSRATDPLIFDFVGRALLCEAEGAGVEAVHRFAGKFQQLTAPVMAKGVEDTAFYVYTRLLSLNDVGGDPAEFGVSVKAFHGASADRAARWPHTMLATSTHDNKRSEDVRARIDVLTESPASWRLQLRRWSRMNRSKKRKLGGEVAPSPNDEYLAYQTLVGCLPVGETLRADFRDRMTAFAIKAAREAKVHTSWVNPDDDYEHALAGFMEDILEDSGRNLFLADLRQVVADVAWYGALNSLSMVLIKLTSPGVPDIYQGNELIDLSLVDPDNRRPVDYARRRELLAAMRSETIHDRDAERWFSDPTDGRGKLFFTWKLLQMRRQVPALFRDGDYVPIMASGSRAAHVVAFARRCGEQGIIAVAGRFFAAATQQRQLPCGAQFWGDTRIVLPFLPSGCRLSEIFTGRDLSYDGDGMLLGTAWERIPGAVFRFGWETES